ncbi:MAG: single-stranded-DNA-specific exonuclease RecJ, partial [Candidatus Omnitrophota bacterium]|nr:single-stranded-DNA-specific exonuclease RecJ [Candidatus Omnitrophota bacterium]
MSNHKILRIASVDSPLRKKLSQQLRISEILAQVLINRGISEASAAEKFLHANLGHLHDPNSFSGMPKAVRLIKQAAGKKEKVMVFGDYDADGITALALLKRALESLGLEVAHYLPHRINEGYGLNKNVLDFARQRNVKLLVTVDCGIANHEEIKEMKRQGIETIITDHHEPSAEELPPAASIINPKVRGETYPYRDLAGVGVAYKLAQALTGSLLIEELDLVCLGTIADSAPLTGENRVIAREGLLGLSRTKKAGLRALIENAGIQNKKFTSTFVSFILAPRINASGRMDSAEASLKLLLSQGGEEAGELAKVLEAHNRQRQKVEGKILKEAEDIINKEVNFKEHKIIVVAKDNWHCGVLGIVASKIADRFYRPAIVISSGEGLCRGSARSIRNFHLF